MSKLSYLCIQTYLCLQCAFTNLINTCIFVHTVSCNGNRFTRLQVPPPPPPPPIQWTQTANRKTTLVVQKWTNGARGGRHRKIPSIDTTERDILLSFWTVVGPDPKILYALDSDPARFDLVWPEEATNSPGRWKVACFLFKLLSHFYSCCSFLGVHSYTEDLSIFPHRC